METATDELTEVVDSVVLVLVLEVLEGVLVGV